MNSTRRRAIALPAIALMLVAACGGPPATSMPKLDDPVEILEEAVRTTSELDYVHARIDVASGMQGAQQTYAVEGDLDLATREFHAVATMSMPAVDMEQQFELLLVGTEMFSRSAGNAVPAGNDTRWQRSQLGGGADPRNGLPATAAIADALGTLLADPGLTVTLLGSEACDTGQCYHVEATLQPEVTWRLVNGALLGGQPSAAPPPVDPAVPAITLDFLVDEATRYLVSIETRIEAQGQSVELRAALSKHDVEFDLLPPPPDQVTDPGIDTGGFGPAPMATDGILDEVGNEVPPAP